jgi:xanthine dehydrogenase YagS FAD-binding subunit
MINRFEWCEPRSAQEAARQATATVAQLVGEAAAGTATGKAVVKAVIKAGGIDVIDLMKEGLLAPSRLVNLRLLPGLETIKYEAGKGMTLGPLLTLSRIAVSQEIAAKYRALVDAAGQIATPNIRNVATLSGNILQRPRCWYFRSADFQCLRKGGGKCYASDGENKYHAIFDNLPCAVVHPSTLAVALVALGADIDLASADGKTRTVRLENFFVGPLKDLSRENLLNAGEIITAVHLPDKKLSSAHLKIQEKDSCDWPLVDCAVALEMNGAVCKQASIVIGAVAAVPWRAKEAESMLAGRTINEELCRKVAVAALKGARPLAQNAYKVELGRVVVEKAIFAAAQNKA